VACLAAIWLPYGFSMGGILEEWDLLFIGQSHPGLWSTFPGQPYGDLLGVRPLLIFPSAVSAWLSGNSFLGFHIFLLLASGMKILAGIAIGRFLFRNRAVALCFGLLFLVYPGDTEQITLRTMHINLANGLALVGTALFLKGYLSRRTVPKVLSLAGSAFLFIFSTLMYDFSVVIYALPPSLIIMRFGFRGALKTTWMKKKTVLIWLIAPIFSLTYILLVMKFNPGTYQVSLAPRGVVHEIFHNFKYLFHSAAYRTFYESWVDSFAILFTQLRNPLIFLGFFAVLASAVFFLRKDGPIKGPNGRSLIRYLAFGFALFVIGYIPVLATPAHLSISQRTFLYVVPGAVIVLGSLLLLCFRFSKPALLTILVGFVFSGLVSQNYQHFRYTEFYTQSIGPYLNYVASAADPNKTIHVVLDHSGYSPYLNGLYSTKVCYGPAVILHKPKDLFLLCKDLPLTNMAIFYRYSIRKGKVAVSAFGAQDMVFDEKDVDVITIPKTSLPRAAGQPLWNNLNTYNRGWAPFRDPHLNDELYIFNADSMWGYSDFPRGDGWAEGIVQMHHFAHESIILPTANSATLLVDLGHPGDTDYLFRLYSGEIIPRQVRTGLTASLNGKPVQLDFVAPAVLQASIPKGIIKDGLNELSFTGVMPVEGVCLTLYKFLLGPKGKLIQKDGEKTSPSLDPENWYTSDKGTIGPFLYSGFSGNEPNGTWTDGTSAVIRFTLNPSKKIGKVHLWGVAYLNPAHQHFEMVVSLNGQRIGREIFEGKDSRALDLSYDVPSAPVTVDQGDNQIVLSIPQPATPQEIGAGDRFLGFFLSKLMVEEDAR
jgi:hypothetical protein